MPLFRRREPLHEQLAREGGLVPRDPRPPWQETGIHGLQRPREWELTLTAEAPGIEADAVRWVTLPDGTILVEDGPDSRLDGLVAAVEERLPPPYRARASRQVGATWAMQASPIEVLALPDAPEGETLDIARNEETTTLAADGRPIFGSLPALERRGEREGRDFAVHAERLDGHLFEITASAL
jgi:hypothetical protein